MNIVYLLFQQLNSIEFIDIYLDVSDEFCTGGNGRVFLNDNGMLGTSKFAVTWRVTSNELVDLSSTTIKYRRGSCRYLAIFVGWPDEPKQTRIILREDFFTQGSFSFAVLKKRDSDKRA